MLQSQKNLTVQFKNKFNDHSMKSISRHIKRISEARNAVIVGVKDKSSDSLLISPKSNVKLTRIPQSTANKQSQFKTFNFNETDGSSSKLRPPPNYKNMANVMKNYHAQSNINVSSPMTIKMQSSALADGMGSGVSFNDIRQSIDKIKKHRHITNKIQNLNMTDKR
jgi:hypothetical protein